MMTVENVEVCSPLSVLSLADPQAGERGPWRAQYCKPIMGVQGLSPQWGPGAEPPEAENVLAIMCRIST